MMKSYSRRGRSAVVGTSGLCLLAGMAAALAGGPPEKMVAFYTTDGAGVCPNNWQEAGYAQGRLLLGTVNPDHVKKTVGEPMADGQPPLHDHSFNGWAVMPAGDPHGIMPSGGDRQLAIATDESGAQISGKTGRSGPNLPFQQFLVCVSGKPENPRAPDGFPVGSISFFASTSCPRGWAPETQADGRFLLPATLKGIVGRATATHWSNLQQPAHTHTSHRFTITRGKTKHVEVGVPAPKKDYAYYSPDFEGGKVRGTGMIISHTNHNTEPVLPFVALLACGKTEGTPETFEVQSGVSTFYSGQSCPDGWAPATGAAGRFLVGIGGNGKQGYAFGGENIDKVETERAMSHSLDQPARFTELDLGKGGVPGSTGTAAMRGKTHGTTLRPPDLTLQFCSKMPG
ncbi:MAG: hypothetical protein AAF441_23775 [Pseudomonadota bacterium]